MIVGVSVVLNIMVLLLTPTKMIRWVILYPNSVLNNSAQYCTPFSGLIIFSYF